MQKRYCPLVFWKNFSPVSDKLKEGISPPSGTEVEQPDRMEWRVILLVLMTEMWSLINALLLKWWPLSLPVAFILTNKYKRVTEGGKDGPDSIREVYCLIMNPGKRSDWLRQTRRSRWPGVCCCGHSILLLMGCNHTQTSVLILWAFNEPPSLIHFLRLYWNIWAES